MVVEEEESDDVGCQTEGADDDDEAGVLDLCGRKDRRGGCELLEGGGMLRYCCYGAYLPVTLTKRSIASMKMLKQRARRKTPLTRAPRISALCHPYE